MTDCTTNQLVFSSLGRKKIRADFKGGCLTSDAGALLLREVDKRLGLIDAINNCIPDPRHPREICGLQATAGPDTGLPNPRFHLVRPFAILQMGICRRPSHKM